MIKVDRNEIPEDISQAKKWWRRRIRQEQKELSPEYMEAASAEIFRKLRSMEEYRNAETIMLYVSAGREVITTEMLDGAVSDGKKVCLPKCLDIDANGASNGRPHEMDARVYSEDYPLIPGAYGIMEPSFDTPVVEAEKIDLIVLPCMGCDSSRRRLGHGAGYYDRYLQLVREDCGKVALCFEAILADELPTEAHDVPMDAVVTEADIY